MACTPVVFFLATLITLTWAIYFIPYMIALGRGHRSAFGISTVNLFFGWCIFGWIGALIWACSNPSGNQQQIIINTGNNAAIMAGGDKPKARGGRIAFLLVLLTILGYLSAVLITKTATNFSDSVESHLVGGDPVASDVQDSPDSQPVSDTQAASGIQPVSINDTSDQQENLPQPNDLVPASSAFAASS